MNRMIAALFHADVTGASLQNARAAFNLDRRPRIHPNRHTQRTPVPAGKVEVMEVFSYGCIACNNFQPTIEKLKAGLPSNAQMVFLPAAFIPSENWVMLQRAFVTAQALGIADRTHQRIFDAVWKSGELAISKSPQPTLEDAARCYARMSGVTADEFLEDRPFIFRRLQSEDGRYANRRDESDEHTLHHCERQISGRPAGAQGQR